MQRPPTHADLQSTRLLVALARCRLSAHRAGTPTVERPKADGYRFEASAFILGWKFHFASSSHGQSTSNFFGVSAAPRTEGEGG